MPAASDRRGCGLFRLHKSSTFEYNAEDGTPRVGEYIASRSAIVCDEAAIAHALHRRCQGSAGRIVDAGRRAEQRDAFPRAEIRRDIPEHVIMLRHGKT